jgi:hypothetical protein
LQRRAISIILSPKKSFRERERERERERDTITVVKLSCNGQTVKKEPAFRDVVAILVKSSYQKRKVETMSIVGHHNDWLAICLTTIDPLHQ